MFGKIPAYAGMTAFFNFSGCYWGFAKVSGCLWGWQLGWIKKIFRLRIVKAA